MLLTPEPLLKTVRISDLRPTQITVGFREIYPPSANAGATIRTERPENSSASISFQ